MSDPIKQLKAARSLAAGSTKVAAARAAEVDPATITKWLKTPGFQDMLLKANEPPVTAQEQAIQGLADLVPQALRTLKDALEGADISTAQQTVALNIIKAAKQLEPVAASEGPSTLAAAIQELDATKPAH